MLVANDPQMNFTQMHEHLRLELLRRIERGSLSVSLLARQTGFGQSHLSNFLRSRKQLSLEGLDRVLTSQCLSAGDLLPVRMRAANLADDGESSTVPVVSYSAALFEKEIRPSAIQTLVRLPAGSLKAVHAPPPPGKRRTWQRFVAVRVPSADARPMEPVVSPDAIALIDRHYISLVAYRPNRPNLYAVRRESQLLLRYADFRLRRLILRPYNATFPIELVEVGDGKSPSDLLVGRVALIFNET